MKKHLRLNLEIDSFFKVNNELIDAEFEYYQLKNTSFDFDYKQKTVLHFTSIDSARLILENNYLRGSNFNQFDDKFEIIDVLNKINNSLTSNWIDIKAKTFAISFTEKTDSQVQESYHYHWQNYGNKNRGVALEFEFKDSTLPYGFYPLTINYVGEDNSIIKNLKSDISNDLSLRKVEKEFLLPILASIKDKNDFKNENEVRLMYKISKPEIGALNNSTGSDIFFSFKENNSINLELRVPFSTPQNDSRRNILTLKKIYLGKSFLNTEDNISSSLLMRYFDDLCKKRGIELKY